MYNELVIFYLQNVIVLANSTYVDCLLKVNCTWQSIFLHLYYWKKKLDFELCKHGTHFSLILVFKSTLPH